MKRRYIELTKNERELLLELAKSGGMNKYQLYAKLCIPYASVSGAIRRLRRWGLIRVLKTGKARTGLPKLTYGIALRSFRYLLEWKEGPEKIGEIVEKNLSLDDLLTPKIFSKWSFFREQGVEEIALERLKFASNSLWLGEVKPGTKEEATRFSAAFYLPFPYALAFPFPILKPDEKTYRWFDAVGKDPELRTYYEKIFEDYTKRLQEFSGWIQELKLALLGESKKAPSVGRR